ncbi:MULTISPECIES: VOC family protein [Paenibacillus]|uniref:Glyoxalase/bleomycin resistance protein/dioxygenase n=2 Tax=Paenibacillus lactis TaxID=228574 RepID=G4HAD7_9BACL|nr:VOC family protein [Paenibacillus lactis]EHB66896.1 Glyoxalase/bleomycin resistance protein/dioxygenase [Paenibacillus lactis 154]MBP1893598.1 putative lactoylglutathione lyase [Paenibacillus lactis]
MNKGFSHCLQIFPTDNIGETARFYENIGFRAVPYMDAAEPHICLYRDSVEIVLTMTDQEVVPNRLRYGSGYDAYLISFNQKEMEEELSRAGVKIVRPLDVTDYNNHEFVFEDIDGRWIAVGNKQ